MWIQLHKGNVDYGTPWELEHESGTVGKLSASCFEVSGSRSKSQGFPKSYVSKSSEGSSLATLRRGWPTTRRSSRPLDVVFQGLCDLQGQLWQNT